MSTHTLSIVNYIKNQTYHEVGEKTTLYQNCSGHYKKFNDRNIRRIHNMVLSSPQATACETQTQLGAAEDGISYATMKDAIVRSRCKVVMRVKKPFLTETHIHNQLVWARGHSACTLDQRKKVVWSDETMLHINDGSQKFIRMVDGHTLTPDHYDLCVKFPTKIMI